MLEIVAVLLGMLNVTAYRSVPEQTDDSPFITSIGERVNEHGCAVSQDLLKKNGGPINYGDVLYIEGIGFKTVNDTMNKRIKRGIDIWVKTYNQEKALHPRKARAWLVIPALDGTLLKSKSLGTKSGTSAKGALTGTVSQITKKAKK